MTASGVLRQKTQLPSCLLLSFWKAHEGLEESTSESELVVTGFASRGGTANTVTAAGLRLVSLFGMQPESAKAALRCASRLADSSVPLQDTSE